MSPTAPAEGRNGPIAQLNGSAGWGDAAVIVPWELYRAYGDLRILDQMWPTMVRWLERTERIAREQRHPGRAARRPVPEPHEQYLWDSGFRWGEWLEPGADLADHDAFDVDDKGDVATAYYAHSARLMSRIAHLLGRHEDATRYRDLAASSCSTTSRATAAPGSGPDPAVGSPMPQRRTKAPTVESNPPAPWSATSCTCGCRPARTPRSCCPTAGPGSPDPAGTPSPAGCLHTTERRRPTEPRQ